MPEIRRMHSEDLLEVNAVFTKAFSHARMEEGLKQHRISPCRIAFLQMYLRRSREGALIAVDRGQVVGFNFNHLFGSTGWMGPLGVLPKYQGVGVGKALVRAGVEHLKRRGARVIGLETMPRNFRNIGFYSGLGFVPGPLCLDLVCQAHRGGGGTRVSGIEVVRFRDVEAADRERLLPGCREVAGALSPGLDYGGEILLNMENRFGDTVVLLDNGAVAGFAICHLEPYGQYEDRRELKMSVLAMRPEPVTRWTMAASEDPQSVGAAMRKSAERQVAARPPGGATGDREAARVDRSGAGAPSDAALDRLALLLEGVKALAALEGLTTVRLHIRSDKWVALRKLLSWGFSVGYSDLRMCLAGFVEDEPASFIHFCRWQ